MIKKRPVDDRSGKNHSITEFQLGGKGKRPTETSCLQHKKEARRKRKTIRGRKNEKKPKGTKRNQKREKNVRAEEGGPKTPAKRGPSRIGGGKPDSSPSTHGIRKLGGLGRRDQKAENRGRNPRLKG